MFLGYNIHPGVARRLIRLAPPPIRSSDPSIEFPQSTFRLPEPVSKAMPSRADHQEIVITTSFESLGLLPELLRAVADKGYTEPTPIQSQAIPIVLS
jgi:hypothetical protein